MMSCKVVSRLPMIIHDCMQNTGIELVVHVNTIVNTCWHVIIMSLYSIITILFCTHVTLSKHLFEGMMYPY